MRRLPCVILAIAGIVLAMPAAARGVWFGNGHSIARFDAATGNIRAATPGFTGRAIAPVRDGGAWLAGSRELVRVDADGTPIHRVDLGFEITETRLPSDEDGVDGVWLAHGRELLHFDAAGALVARWSHAEPITAIAAAGPNAIFVASSLGIDRYREDGHRLGAARADDLGIAQGPTRLLLDRLGGYVWAATDAQLIQLDTLAALNRTALVRGSPALMVLGLDDRTGTLWVLAGRQIEAYDRDGKNVVSAPLPTRGFESLSTAVADGVADLIWVGDAAGLGAFNHATRQWFRVTAGDPVTLLAGHAPAPTPYVMLLPDEIEGRRSLRLKFGATCGDVSCAAGARYLRELSLRATIDDREITSGIAVDRDSGVAVVGRDAVEASAQGQLSATVIDAYGLRSEPLHVDLHFDAASRPSTQAKANLAPTVALTAPVNNATFVAPATVALAATAGDSDGTITKVEFYQGATKLGTDTTAPYTWSWNAVPIGTYSLTAKAYDNLGAVTTSAASTIQVKANVAPTVALTSPANNSAYTAPATINLAATATDSDGTIAKVEFFRGTTKLNTDTAAPYAFTWSNVAGGTYSLTAKATDDKGAVTTSAARTVTVNNPPTVSITAPANNAAFVAPATITINASASDPGGSIAKVQFYRDGVLLGQDTTSPYSYSWANVALGTYVLTARATDNLGATTNSGPVTVTVATNTAPTVVLTAPANGTTIVAGVPVTLTATAADSDGTIARVEFYGNIASVAYLLGTATTSPYSLTAPLSTVFTSLTAVAVDDKGAKTTSAPVNVNVVANQYPTVTLTAPQNGQVYAGTSPPDITLSASATDVDGSIAGVGFYLQRIPWLGEIPEPTLLATVTSPPYQFVWRSVPFTEETDADSAYVIWAEAIDDAGAATASDGANIWVRRGTPWSVALVEPRIYGDYSTPTVFNAPATIVLVAMPNAPPNPASNPIARVEFLAGANLLAALTSPNGANGEFVHVWRNVPSGTHAITVRLTDSLGLSTSSTAGSIIVRNVAPPTVAVDTPANEQFFLGNNGVLANVAIAASVAPASRTFRRVEPEVDGETWSYLYAPPYSATINGINLAAGRHVVTALAYDDLWQPALALPVHITVGDARPALVVQTSPAPGANLDGTTPIALTADALAPDQAITKVEFHDSVLGLLGQATAPPYTLTRTLATGTRVLTAKAWVGLSLVAVSRPVTVAVGAGGNAPPIVSFVTPTAGQTCTSGALLALEVNASDPDGTVAKVDFFDGTTFIATDPSAPYSATWTCSGVGVHTLKATATDNGGRTTTAAVNVTVVANALPMVSFIAPVAGQACAAGVPLALQASASDPDGTIARVEFLDGATVIGTATAAPYSTTWTCSGAGSRTLAARATDNAGGITTATVSVSVTANALPAVALALPRDGQSFATGATVALVATASDADGSIARVEFHANGALLGSATGAPYRFDWSNVATGTHALSATAFDDRGAIASTGTATITVAPLAIAVSSPAASAATPADFVTVIGTYAAPPNSGVTVNGVVAHNDGRNFVVNNLPLVDGPNVITTTLTTANGETFTDTRTVTRTGLAPIQIIADPPTGFAPFTTTLRLLNRTANPMVQVAVTTSGGTADASVFDGETLARLSLLTAGFYVANVTLTDAIGNTYPASVPILVGDIASQGETTKSVWRGFVNALASSDPSIATQPLSQIAKAKYASALTTLAPHLPSIVASWSEPLVGLASPTLIELGVNRTIGGVNRLFLIYMLLDTSGVWRIDSM